MSDARTVKTLSPAAGATADSSDTKPVRASEQLDWDALATLFIMAYDGFVINRRLNDLRDIERLSDAMCGILLNSARKPTHNVKEGVVIHPGAVQN